MVLADYVEHRFTLKMAASATTIVAPLLHVLGAQTMHPATLNQLQLASVTAYLVVAHDDTLSLGVSVLLPMIWQTKHIIIREDWQEDGHSRPMPVLYEGNLSTAMHNVMMVPPRYDSLENIFWTWTAN